MSFFGAEPEYKEIFGIPPVGFKAVDTSYPLDLSGFKVFGQKSIRTSAPMPENISGIA